MERVSDEWLNEMIPKYGAIDSKSKGANVYLALCELKERRRKESEAMREIEKLFEPGIIKKVDDKILEALIAGQGNIITGSWNAIMYALWELRVRRKAEKEQVDGVDVKTWSVKKWFQKINEELDELKEAVWFGNGGFGRIDHISSTDKFVIACEAAETITAITSMLEAMGIDEQQRQAAQRRVNNNNRQRGRF